MAHGADSWLSADSRTALEAQQVAGSWAAQAAEVVRALEVVLAISRIDLALLFLALRWFVLSNNVPIIWIS